MPMHHRRSIRLKQYDYAQAGAYFITVCVDARACVFGEIVGDEMHLNDAGRVVVAEWEALPRRFPNLELDAFTAMPNHVHGIVVIADARQTTRADGGVVQATADDFVGAGLVPAPADGATTRVAPTTVGRMVGAFKSLTTVSYTYGVRQMDWPAFRRRLWQRNYYEHVIRNDESLNRLRQYIVDNPARWASDDQNPHRAPLSV